MRILVSSHFYIDRWTIGCLAEDCRTTVASRTEAKDKETLFKLLRYVGASEEQMTKAEESIQISNHVSVWVDLIPGRKNLLRLWRPYSDVLEPLDK
jgi:hypothetical protein